MADTELESIIARLKTNTSEMRRGFEEMVSKADESIKKVSKLFGDLGKDTTALGKTMLTNITAPFLALVGLSVKTAAEIENQNARIANSFGDALESVVEWADVTATAVNRTRQEILRAADDFYTFLKPIGVAPERALLMAKALTQLSTDLAAFRKISQETAAEALLGGMTGATRGLRQLGIDLSNTAMDAELLRLGFRGNTAEATEAQKAIARFNLILASTAQMQGQAMQASDSFSSTQREMGNVLEDVRQQIGEIFMPTVKSLMETVSALGRKFLSLSAEGKKSALMFAAIAAGIGPALIGLGVLIKVVGFAVSGFATLGRTAVTAFTMLGRAAVTVVAPLLSIPGAIVAGLTVLYLFRDTVAATFQSVVEYLSNLTEPLQAPVKEAFENMVAWAKALAAPLTEPIRLAFQFIKDMAFHVQEYFTRAMNAIVNQYNRFIESVKWLFGDASPIAEFTAPIKEGINDIASYMDSLPPFNFERIGAAANKDLGDIKEMFRKAMESIKELMPDLSFDLDLSEHMNLPETNAEMTELLALLEELFKGFDDLGENVDDNFTTAAQMAKELGDSMREAFLGRLEDVNSLGDAMLAVLDRLKAKLLEIAFFGTEGDGGLFGPLFGKVAGAFGNFFAPRATGGPVNPGQPHLVGEKGPELFVPASPGSVKDSTTTRGMGGKTIEVHQTFNFPPDNAEITERMVVIGAAMRDQAISVFRQASNTGF